MIRHQVRDSVGDDSRLSATCAREDEQRSIDVLDGVDLGLVQGRIVHHVLAVTLYGRTGKASLYVGRRCLSHFASGGISGASR